MKKRIGLTVLLAILLCLLLSGCFVKTVDELYLLPRHSEEYNDLQSAIDAVMKDGTVYCAPVSGANQQTVQLADLDGDEKDEAVVFLKTTGEKPLCAYIFDQQDGVYQNVAVIEGIGSAFASAEYVQLDDQPGMEIILGRQLSDQVVQSMSVCSLREGRIVELLNTNYSEYITADLDSDGLRDVFALRFDAEQAQGVAELYRWREGQMEREPEVMLTNGVQSIKRIIAGQLMQEIPAVFVASVYDTDSIVTDVFAFSGGGFTNLTHADGEHTVPTLRSYFVYACDIDGDGLIELPELLQLPQSEDGGDRYSLIYWYNLDGKGQKTVKQTTYHCFSGGWYVTVPEQWREKLTISRGEEVGGVRGYVFSEWKQGGQPPEEIFTLYTFTGEDRNELASADGRFLVSEKGDVSCSAKMGTSVLAKGMSEEDLKMMFNYIQIDWNSGET